MSAPAIAVVVATRGRAGRLEKLLSSLAEQTTPRDEFEVIVVDDGSNDATPSVLAKWSESGALPLTALRNEESAGPAAARNRGWRRASAPLIAFTDDDCEAAEDWLKACVDASDGAPGAIVQGVTRPNPREQARAGAFSRTRDVDGTGPWFETCNIVYPLRLLEELGGFDESFLEALGEDTDLGWRALSVGVRKVRAPKAVVFHAVESAGPVEHLRFALRGADAVLLFKRHPELRREALAFGVVRSSAHLRLLVGILGMASRRRTLAVVLVAPYLRQLHWRCSEARASVAYAPYFILYDLLTLYTTVRGAIRHRVFLI